MIVSFNVNSHAPHRASWRTSFIVCYVPPITSDIHDRISPPKIRTVKILDNPFDDIIPRITAAEKRAQQLAKEQGIREREQAARRKSVKK